MLAAQASMLMQHLPLTHVRHGPSPGAGLQADGPPEEVDAWLLDTDCDELEATVDMAPPIPPPLDALVLLEVVAEAPPAPSSVPKTLASTLQPKPATIAMTIQDLRSMDGW